MEYETKIAEARDLLINVQRMELEKTGKPINKSKFKWIMSQKTFDGIAEVFCKVGNINTLQYMELWGIPIEIREKMPFDNIGIIKEGF